MNRLKFAGQLIDKLSDINSVLDVGCRDCELKDWVPLNIKYFGNDLYQNKLGTVDYVGDMSMLKVDQKFDLVVALDILEHVENPTLLFEKLLTLANIALIVSLPNCYDLKNRLKFLLRGHLGGKYAFTNKVIEDRHRWIMSRPEIRQFYFDKALQHHVSDKSLFDMKYGDPNGSYISRMRSVARFLPPNLCTETVFGVFVK